MLPSSLLVRGGTPYGSCNVLTTSLLRLTSTPLRLRTSYALSRACSAVGLSITLNSPGSSLRQASSSSSSRWKARQSRDRFASEAKVSNLKSRAAFKLLEIDEKHHLFKPGQTVVDLGFAPGSWSQVAKSRTKPSGRVLGIDVIPCQPPAGVSSIQGNFLSPEVQAQVRDYVKDYFKGRQRGVSNELKAEIDTHEALEIDTESYVDRERHDTLDNSDVQAPIEELEDADVNDKKLSQKLKDARDGRVVDVVLSDMSAPWEQTSGFHLRSLSNPYRRMMNTSGMPFRDHAGSMDLCLAALKFSYDALKTGGAFICKFYQGKEDKQFEMRLKKLFEKVHREKPESSRSESKEAYFIALRRKPDVAIETVFPPE